MKACLYIVYPWMLQYTVAMCGVMCKLYMWLLYIYFHLENPSILIITYKNNSLIYNKKTLCSWDMC